MPAVTRRRLLAAFLALAAVGGAAGGWHWYRSSRRAAGGYPEIRQEGWYLRELETEESVTTEVNAKAPGFASVTLDDRPIRSIDFIGDKVLLLEFWSVFCTSCIQEMPFLAELQKKYAGRGLTVIGINTDFFGQERVSRFLGKLPQQPEYPVVLDRDQSISKAFNVEALPVTVIIDSSGWIRMYHLGYKREDQRTIEEHVDKWTRKIRESVETVRPVEGKTPIKQAGQGVIKVGEPVPEVVVLGEQDEKVSLAEYCRGRRVVLFFWSLFCQPCREEMPFLSVQASRPPSRGKVSFLSVNLDSPRLVPQVKRFLGQKPLSFPTVFDALADPPGSLAERLGVSYTPTVIMIGADGKVGKVIVGTLAREKLMEEILMFATPGSGEGGPS